jgi:hypothetical protein
MGLETDLDDVERRKILPVTGIELRLLGHPAHRRRYTDCSIPARSVKKMTLRNRADRRQSLKPDSRNAWHRASNRISLIFSFLLHFCVEFGIPMKLVWQITLC